MITASEAITATSFVTLHYRVSLDDGTEVISTFGMNPATLQMGAGQLSTNLENCLLGLEAEEERHFELEAGLAYGARNPLLLQKIERASLPASVKLIVGQPIHLTSDTGIPYAGMIEAVDDEWVTVDFNHPLAGRKIFFDVAIIGVL